MIRARMAQGFKGRGCRCVFKGRCCIDKTAIKEHKPLGRLRRLQILLRHCNSSVRKGCWIAPGQGRSAVVDFLPNDPAAGFLHSGVSPFGQFRKQGRLAAPGATGQNKEAVFVRIHSFCMRFGAPVLISVPM